MLLSELVFGNWWLKRNPIIFQIINLLFEKLTLQIKTNHSDSFAYFEAMIWPFEVENLFYGHKTGIKMFMFEWLLPKHWLKKLHCRFWNWNFGNLYLGFQISHRNVSVFETKLLDINFQKNMVFKFISCKIHNSGIISPDLSQHSNYS